MQLDKETLENLLKNLSKAKFDGICRVILTEYFHLDPLNVDRRGDGGGDWITIPYGGGKRAFVAQATIQEANWKSKCIEDAEKAANNFKCRKYLFLTSRRRDSVDLLDIENQIQDKFDIPASCLGAVEIADILLSRKLTSRAFHEAGINIGVAIDERPDRSEQLLFGALSLSSGAAALRNEVHEDAIFFALSSRGSMLRDELISSVIDILQCGEHREGRVNGRIDSLMARGAIIKNPETQHLELSAETFESLQLAKAVYNEQLLDLSEKINAYIMSFDCSITDDNVLANISIFASRAMIAGTIKSSGRAGVNIQNTLLLEQLGEPYEDLKEIITGTTESQNVDQIVEGILSVTQAHPLVFRLSQELLHFAIDGINPVHHVKALGVGSWTDTETLLDASVAIPFLCSQLTRPSSGRFSRGAIAGVAALQRAGSSLFIPRDYLQEAAVHLLHAVDYCRPFENPDILVASPNGYVSHYHTLRRDGVPIPASLIKFLLLLAPSLRNVNVHNIVSQIANDLEGKFNELGISKINLGDLHPSFIENVSENYSRHMSSSRGARESILIKHDTRTLAWMKKSRTEGRYGKICLTWDELMIAVSRDDENAGWAVTPHQVSDLISMGSKRDESALLSVVHELAATRTAHEDLVGKLLDDVVGYAREGKLAWEVVSELSKLRQELHERALSEGSPGSEELKSIASEFWKRHGINVDDSHERTSVTQEEIERALEQA